MSYLGDRALGSTVDVKFNTVVNGVGVTLAGSPIISVYKSGSTTEITAGVTLTVDYDSRTGLNDVSIVASSGNGFAAGFDYQAVITTGTVNGIAQNGRVVGEFSIGMENVSQIAGSTTAATNLRKSAEAIARGTVTTGGSTTSVPTSALSLAGSAATGVVADQFKNCTIYFDGDTTTAGLRDAQATISASSASNTPTLTVGTLPATPVSGDTFSIG